MRRRKSTLLPLRPHELHILVALAGGERHGYAIQQEVEARSDGALRLDASYPVIG
jgi:DNA-binding PadR family transcriptional regulator